MPIEVSIRDFAKTGRFGPVHLGMHRTEVRKFLGNPDRMKENSDEWGSYEFLYEHDALTSICNPCLHPAFGHFENHLFTNAAFTIQPWLLSEHVLRLSAIADFLQEDTLAFTIRKDGPRPTIVFPSGVELRFDIHEHHGRIRSNGHAELYYLGIESIKKGKK